MSYTPPAHDALDLQFGSGYTAPAHNALDLQFGTASGGSTPVGVGAVVLEFIAAGTGTTEPPTFTGTGAVVLEFTPDAAARHGVAGQGAAVLEFAPAGIGAHPRYQLRGQVQDEAGLLVDRRVRAYRRSTGALVAEVDTVAGAFVIPAGFELDEFYLVPIDLSPGAQDWAPPCANRVLSVLVAD